MHGSRKNQGALEILADPRVCREGVHALSPTFIPTPVSDPQQWLWVHLGSSGKASASCSHQPWPQKWSCFLNLSSRCSCEPNPLPALQGSSAGCLWEPPAQLCHWLCLCRHCGEQNHHQHRDQVVEAGHRWRNATLEHHWQSTGLFQTLLFQLYRPPPPPLVSKHY